MAWYDHANEGNTNFLRFPAKQLTGEYVVTFTGEPVETQKKWGPHVEVSCLNHATVPPTPALLPLQSARLCGELLRECGKTLKGKKVRISWETPDAGDEFSRQFYVKVTA